VTAVSGVGLVLVHGGQHSGSCWDPTVDALRRRDPAVSVLAVDLPGRGPTPGNLMDARIAEWGRSIVAQVDTAGLDRVVIVGHSLAGLSVPDAVARMGPDRVHRMILMGAAVPPQGKSIVDDAHWMLRWYVRRLTSRPVPTPPMPRRLALMWFCNGMNREQKRFALSRMCPESPSIVAERVDRSGLARSTPRTWILTRRDRVMSPRTQHRAIRNLGGVDELVEIDSCHDAMISVPDELARILLARLT
jgi:pimeloyl-ACP methyl ester carboxylesterase